MTSRPPLLVSEPDADSADCSVSAGAGPAGSSHAASSPGFRRHPFSSTAEMDVEGAGTMQRQTSQQRRNQHLHLSSTRRALLSDSATTSPLAAHHTLASPAAASTGAIVAPVAAGAAPGLSVTASPKRRAGGGVPHTPAPSPHAQPNGQFVFSGSASMPLRSGSTVSNASPASSAASTARAHGRSVYAPRHSPQSSLTQSQLSRVPGLSTLSPPFCYTFEDQWWVLTDPALMQKRYASLNDSGSGSDQPSLLPSRSIQVGPLSKNILQTMLRNEHISQECLVWHAEISAVTSASANESSAGGGGGWTPIKHVPILQSPDLAAMLGEPSPLLMIQRSASVTHGAGGLLGHSPAGSSPSSASGVGPAAGGSDSGGGGDILQASPLLVHSLLIDELVQQEQEYIEDLGTMLALCKAQATALAASAQQRAEQQQQQQQQQQQHERASSGGSSSSTSSSMTPESSLISSPLNSPLMLGLSSPPAAHKRSASRDLHAFHSLLSKLAPLLQTLLAIHTTFLQALQTYVRSLAAQIAAINNQQSSSPYENLFAASASASSVSANSPLLFSPFLSFLPLEIPRHSSATLDPASSHSLSSSATPHTHAHGHAHGHAHAQAGSSGAHASAAERAAAPTPTWPEDASTAASAAASAAAAVAAASASTSSYQTYQYVFLLAKLLKEWRVFPCAGAEGTGGPNASSLAALHQSIFGATPCSTDAPGASIFARESTRMLHAFHASMDARKARLRAELLARQQESFATLLAQAQSNTANGIMVGISNKSSPSVSDGLAPGALGSSIFRSNNASSGSSSEEDDSPAGGSTSAALDSAGGLGPLVLGPAIISSSGDPRQNSPSNGPMTGGSGGNGNGSFAAYNRGGVVNRSAKRGSQSNLQQIAEGPEQRVRRERAFSATEPASSFFPAAAAAASASAPGSSLVSGPSSAGLGIFASITSAQQTMLLRPLLQLAFYSSFLSELVALHRSASPSLSNGSPSFSGESSSAASSPSTSEVDAWLHFSDGCSFLLSHFLAEELLRLQALQVLYVERVVFAASLDQVVLKNRLKTPHAPRRAFVQTGELGLLFQAPGQQTSAGTGAAATTTAMAIVPSNATAAAAAAAASTVVFLQWFLFNDLLLCGKSVQRNANSVPSSSSSAQSSASVTTVAEGVEGSEASGLSELSLSSPAAVRGSSFSYQQAWVIDSKFFVSASTHSTATLPALPSIGTAGQGKRGSSDSSGGAGARGASATRFGFEIRSGARSTALYARSEAERDAWVNALSACIIMQRRGGYIATEAATSSFPLPPHAASPVLRNILASPATAARATAATTIQRCHACAAFLLPAYRQAVWCRKCNALVCAACCTKPASSSSNTAASSDGPSTASVPSSAMMPKKSNHDDSGDSDSDSADDSDDDDADFESLLLREESSTASCIRCEPSRVVWPDLTSTPLRDPVLMASGAPGIEGAQARRKATRPGVQRMASSRDSNGREVVTVAALTGALTLAAVAAIASNNGGSNNSGSSDAHSDSNHPSAADPVSPALHSSSTSTTPAAATSSAAGIGLGSAPTTRQEGFKPTSSGSASTGSFRAASLGFHPGSVSSASSTPRMQAQGASSGEVTPLVGSSQTSTPSLSSNSHTPLRPHLQVNLGPAALSSPSSSRSNSSSGSGQHSGTNASLLETNAASGQPHHAHSSSAGMVAETGGPSPLPNMSPKSASGISMSLAALHFARASGPPPSGSPNPATRTPTAQPRTLSRATHISTDHSAALRQGSGSPMSSPELVRDRAASSQSAPTTGPASVSPSAPSSRALSPLHGVHAHSADLQWSATVVRARDVEQSGGRFTLYDIYLRGTSSPSNAASGTAPSSFGSAHASPVLRSRGSLGNFGVSSLSEGGSSSTVTREVSKRYSDFKMLDTQIKKSRKARGLPKLPVVFPASSVFQQFSASVKEERRQAFEVYLNTLLSSREESHTIGSASAHSPSNAAAADSNAASSSSSVSPDSTLALTLHFLLQSSGGAHASVGTSSPSDSGTRSTSGSFVG